MAEMESQQSKTKGELGFYEIDELRKLGHVVHGDDVWVSRKSSIYGKLEIGNHVRIDDFCMLVGNILLGNYIHIAAFVSLHGSGGGTITLKDHTSIASYSVVYAGSDNFNGDYFVGPMAPKGTQKIIFSDIVLEKYSQVCVRCTLLPGAYLAEGTVLQAHSLLYRKTECWSNYSGCPAEYKNERKRGLLKWIEE